MKQFFCVGTYTEPILFGTGQIFQGKGEGIYLCSLEDGEIQILQCLKLSNPSYLCIDEGYKKIYTVNEGKEYEGQTGGGVTQVDFADGVLKKEFSMNSGGADPCHIAMAPNRRFLSVANFAGGSVAVFPLDEKGNMTGERWAFQHTGSSVHPVRQKGPHAHGTVFWGSERRMMVPDLGIDKVKMYSYRDAFAIPVPEEDISVEPGSGPRFGGFSSDGKHFYLINELASSVVHYSCENSIAAGDSDLGCRMVFRQEISTLPDGLLGEDNICSDLHLTPDGRFLYASNRGHDSICCFQIEEGGSLKRIQWVKSGGKTPRNFCIDPMGKYVLVGNQESDGLTVFEIGKDGGLTEKNRVDFPSPVCIRFFKEGSLLSVLFGNCK